MLIRTIFLIFFLFPATCYSYSGDLPRYFAIFAGEKLVQLGECDDIEHCRNNRRVLFSEGSEGFHLTFYGVSDVKKIQSLIALMVDEYDKKALKIKMSISFSKEMHMPNKGFLTFKQRKQPYIYFVINQGA
ncbi:hypothetical protein [Cellvibrio sp. UBA7661]|uniref:hypothetical protein n=1 Tax=Cellvibrio sp. UBA7661 TaxID=1946311 RepID=UPI002F350DEE